MLPIGLLIKEELENQERSVSWLARKLHLDRSNIYRLFQKNSIDTGLLLRVSMVLNRDFFSDYSRDLSVRISSEDRLSARGTASGKGSGQGDIER